MCGKRNTTGSAVRELEGVDKLFDMLTRAMNSIEVNLEDLIKICICLEMHLTLLQSSKPPKTEEKIPLADSSFQGLNTLGGLGIGFLVLMVIICSLICLLALRERKTGRQSCSWCPAIRYSPIRLMDHRIMVQFG